MRRCHRRVRGLQWPRCHLRLWVCRHPRGDCDCFGNQMDLAGICGGDCFDDDDMDGICDDIETYGCTYPLAETTTPTPWPMTEAACFHARARSTSTSSMEPSSIASSSPDDAFRLRRHRRRLRWGVGQHRPLRGPRRLQLRQRLLHGMPVLGCAGQL